MLERGGVLGRGSALEGSSALMVLWKVVVFARAAGGCGEEGYSGKWGSYHEQRQSYTETEYFFSAGLYQSCCKTKFKTKQQQ